MILNLPCLHMMLKMSKVYWKFLLLEASSRVSVLHLILIFFFFFESSFCVSVSHLILGASLFLAERPIARLPAARGRQEGGTQSQVSFFHFIPAHYLSVFSRICNFIACNIICALFGIFVTFMVSHLLTSLGPLLLLLSLGPLVLLLSFWALLWFGIFLLYFGVALFCPLCHLFYWCCPLCALSWF